ncbi:MAG: response regulator [Alphaproteobacteria bacterium]|nr:response regulator [Alphaproteobacteria bacterium]
MPKCLVIDDVEVTRFTASQFLEELGFSVSSANDPQDAVSTLKKDNFDVILLDWHIGKESGIDLLKQIRSEMSIRTPVIVFSGVKGKDMAPVAINAGASAFLEKPTTKEKLKSALKNLSIQVA